MPARDERAVCGVERAWSRGGQGRPAARGAQQTARWSRRIPDPSPSPFSACREMGKTKLRMTALIQRSNVFGQFAVKSSSIRKEIRWAKIRDGYCALRAR
jgi:hypothetical protein